MQGYPMLEAVLKERGVRKYVLAKEIGMTAPDLSYRLTGRKAFSFDEQSKIAGFLGYRREFLFLNFGPPPSAKLQPEGGSVDAQ